MSAMFAAMLPALYQRLGQDATFSHAGATPVVLKVVFDQPGGNGLGGMQLTVDPVVRLQAAAAPLGVSRGDEFVIAGATWKAREGGLPLLDGAELQVPLARG
jgi:hypothetical protein